MRMPPPPPMLCATMPCESLPSDTIAPELTTVTVEPPAGTAVTSPNCRFVPPLHSIRPPPPAMPSATMPAELLPAVVMPAALVTATLPAGPA